MRPPTKQEVTQTQHGATKAVDHRAWPDDIVYAPEDMTFDSYQQRGRRGTKGDAGNALRMRGKTGLHQFAHLSKSLVKKGDKVKKGQPIAKMGYTGYTIPQGSAGKHLHYWILTPNGYVYPPNLYTEPFGEKEKKDMYKGHDAKYWNHHAIDLHKARNKAEAEVKSLKQQLAKTDKTIKSLKDEVKDCEKQLKALSKEFVNVQKSNESYLKKNKELASKVKDQSKEIKRLEKEVGVIMAEDKKPKQEEDNPLIRFLRLIFRR